MKIACVLKTGGDYDSDYVAHFLDGLNEHVENFEFMLLAGSEYPGWWSKMELFRPDVKGDLLYFDLDTMIVGDLDDILAVDRLTVLSDFNVPDRMASGMMFIPEYERASIWNEWIADPEGHMRAAGGHGDGGFLAKYWARAQRWQDIVPGQVVSYKNHVRDKGVPAEARVVCFHGRPRPRDIRWMLR
jgi:hypothetical protein